MNHFTMSAGFRRLIVMSKKKRRNITNKNRDALIQKASSLCNKGVPLAQVLQRCRISYRQLLSLSKSETFKAAVIFRYGYRPSKVWFGQLHTQALREFVFRNRHDFTREQLGWLINRSPRTVSRYIQHEKTKQK